MAQVRPQPRNAPESHEIASHLVRLGKMIFDRRRTAGLSRAALALRAGMSESTLKNLEAGRHRPSQLTLTQLLSIPELGLSAADLVPGGPPTDTTLPSGPPMNCWISPGFDPIAMVHDLSTRLAGQGGTIEQTFLYLDSKSAASWYAIANQSNYATNTDSAFLHKAAMKIRESIGNSSLEVLGLGCGDGRKEVRLVQLLTAGMPSHSILLYLLDISQPLLGHAFKHAVETLSNGVSIFAIQGNFHHLPLYTQLLRSKRPQRRLMCMFGGTFGNLANEILYVRNNLVGQQEGDLLLLHVSRTHGSRERPAEIMRQDPYLSGSIPAELNQLQREWLTGPIERYSRPVGAPVPEMEVQTRFDTSSCPVPGSYAIEFSVLVRGEGNERRFTMAFIKRYDREGLAECLSSLGWEPIEIWDREVGNSLLGLFRWRG